VGVVKALVLLGLVACSVPDIELDGKQCPCADGYVCNKQTNTCHLADAGVDATPPGSSCLGAEAARLFTLDFNTSLDLTTGAGTWAATGGRATQSDAGAALAYAYSTSAVPSDYRVAATLIPGSGTSLGVAFRVGLASKTMYICEWRPAAGQLALEWTNNGGQPSELTSVTATGASATATVTIHAEARGTSLSCCIDELSTAKLMNVTDTHYANGQPGLMTNLATASFDDLIVSALPI
jgi:hypothetical protein